MDKRYILFDLDGTLSDPKEGIINSIHFSLRFFGIEIENKASLLPFIGPPLRETFKKHFGFNKKDTETAVEKFREYYSGKGIFQNALYKGVDTLLENLKNKGKTLIVSTSKPTVYTNRILKHFNIDRYFHFVSGSELDGTRDQKCEVIRYAIENMGINDVKRAVMIGDRKHDIIGAKENGMESIGVLYGYGDLQELQNAKATFIAENITMLNSSFTET